MTFKRARTDAQRDLRRRSILDTAATMLSEMPVAGLSLNELSRRVGLAKSNVLRYFESREAVLLELLNSELYKWIEGLDFSAIDHRADRLARVDQVAAALAAGLAARPVLCDLISAQAAVLERNVSSAVVLLHKRAINESVGVLSQRLTEALPELDQTAVYEIIIVTLLMTAGAWPQSQPNAAVLAAYDEDAHLAAHRMNFAPFLKRTIILTTIGLLSIGAEASSSC